MPSRKERRGWNRAHLHLFTMSSCAPETVNKTFKVTRASEARSRAALASATKADGSMRALGGPIGS